MTTASPEPDGHGPRPRAPWLVLALVLACAAATALYVREAERARDRLRFENAVQRTEDDVRTRLDTYVAVLRAGAGLWAVRGEVTREEWRVFVGNLRLAERYPGVQGVGFSARVPAAGREAFVAAARREGTADYDIRPPGDRDEYLAIIYLEPLDSRNRGALGFDMSSEGVRREALERARDTGEPAATGRVTLVQEIVEPKQAGFLIYAPVYRGGVTPPTVEERRANLRGYVYSPFRADDLLRGIFGQESSPHVDFRVYDGPAADPAHLLHATRPEGDAGAPGRRPRFAAERRFEVAGRTWTLAFVPRPGSEVARGGWLPYSILLVGLFFGGALFFVTRARLRARREAAAAAADLRASESRFRTLVEQSPVSTQILAPDGRTLRVNRAWEELWGVTLEQLGDYNMLADAQLEEKGIAAYIRRGFAGEAVEIPAILYDPEQTIPGKTRHADPRRWVSARIYPVKDEAGRVREVVLMHDDITERRRAEEELRESHRRVTDILESISDAFYAVDADWRFTYVNRRAEEHWQRSRADLIGRSLWEEFPQLAGSDAAAELRRAAAERRPVNFEAVSPILDRWLEASIYPTGDGLSVYFRDITERRRAEEELREQSEIVETVNRVGQLLTSELDLRRVVQAVTDAATEVVGARFGSFFYNVLDEAGASYMLYTLSGVPRAAFEHFPMPRATDLFGPTFRGEGTVLIEDVRRDPRYGKNSPYFGMPEGHLPVTSYLAVPVTSRTGEVLGGLFLGHPEAGVFTERHARIVEGLAAQAAVAMDNARLYEAARAERERAQAAEGRAAFLASASAALDASLEFETTLATVTHLAVPALADFCFFDLVTPDRKVRRVAWKHRDTARQKEFDDVWQFVPPQDFEGHPVARALRSGRTEFVPEITDEWMRRAATSPAHYEFMRRLGSHAVLTVLLVAREETIGALTFSLSDPARRFTEADVATAEDLARRAALAVSNARLYREAQEANRVKDEFLATLSHELRTPLTSVLGWAKMLRTERFDPEVTARALEAIERNAAAQTALINDLLDVSRIITGKLRLNVSRVELPSVVEAAAESLRPAAEARGVRLEVRAGGPPAPVSADADRLRQVVWNLLSNAIKFTPKGGRVEVTYGAAAGHAELVVADTGQGIAPEFLPHVFERFRQADGRITREHGGLGLGLAIVRHLVELHGGTIRADSEGEGRGATFTVRLPLLRDADFGLRNEAEQVGAAVDSNQSATRLPPFAVLSGLHVLVVEDDADSRALLVAVLKQGGARVTSAASAADGLDLLRRLRPDALVADIGMPGEDGYELMRRVRALPREEGGATPAAALTAYARPEDRARALDAGYQQHLPKPIDPAALNAAVAALCGRRKNGPA